MDQTQSSNTMWYVVGAVVIIALAFWYINSKKPQTVDTESTAAEQTQSNTTAAISDELNQTSDGSAELDAAAAASAQSVQGF